LPIYNRRVQLFDWQIRKWTFYHSYTLLSTKSASELENKQKTTSSEKRRSVRLGTFIVGQIEWLGS